MTRTNHSEDLVNGVVGRQGTIEDHKVTLQTLRNVVTTSPRMNHGSQKLNGNDKSVENTTKNTSNQDELIAFTVNNAIIQGLISLQIKIPICAENGG